MQDNWLNDKLEDQGWQAMKDLLDLEMPVESKKRRPIIWIFFLIGIGLCSILGAYYYQTIENEPYSHVIPSKEPSLSIADHPVDLTMEHSKEKALSSTTVETNNITEIETPNNQTNTRANKLFPIKRNSRYTTFEIPFLEKSIKLERSTQIPAIERSVYLNPTNLNRSAFELHFLPGLHFNTVVPDSNYSYSLKPLPSRRPKNWINFLSGQLYFDGHSTLSGGGLQYARGIFIGAKSKSILSVGLGWKHHQVRLPEKIIYTSNPNTFSGGMMDVTLSGSNTSERTSTSQVDSVATFNKAYRLNYASLPITFHHRINRKLEWISAIHVDYLLYDPINGGGLVEESTANFSADFSLDNLQLNRWNLSGQAGLYYQMTNHFGIGYQYEFGLNNLIINDPAEKVFIRRHALSARWRF